MTPLIKVCNIGNCKIVVTDLTQKSNEYINEEETEVEVYYKQGKFKYSETCTINILQKNYFSIQEDNKKYKIINSYFTDHCSYLDEQYIKLDKDGYYTIHHIILPTLEWLREELKKEDNITKYKDFTIYVTDCKNIYKYCKESDSLEVINLELISQVNCEDTTISRICYDYFSICKLFECYIRLCKSLFNNINLRCINKNSNSDELTFNRDFLWMTINVIKYHLQKNEFLEAERILESINYCNGFCQQDIQVTKSSGCGCSR